MRDALTLTHAFEDLTYTAGANSVPISFRGLPVTHGKYFCHLKKITVDVALTPTFGAGNEPTIRGANFGIFSLQISDGVRTLLQGDGGLNLLRLRERIWTGRARMHESDTDVASATARYFRRVFHVGPPQFAGAPGDWLIPVGMLTNGNISGTYGTLAQVGTGAAGDPTAVTATFRVTAHLALLEHINIPPMYDYRTYSATGSRLYVGGKAAVESVTMLDGATYPAIGAGDFGVVRLNLGTGGDITTVQAETLFGSYQDDFASGHIGGFSSEPEAASDDGVKMVNTATPTALVAATADVAPIYWSPPGARISKLIRVREGFEMSWGGTQTTAIVAVGKVLPRAAEQLAEQMQRAGVPAGAANAKLDTLSKKKLDERSDSKFFLPVKVHV